MTVTAGLLPTYVCQRDGIEHARRICQAVPGAGLDDRIGQLLIDTLTPLTIEAALTVSAELEHRADQADALRAAHVERARYHAGLARRRYLAVDPANQLVADTLEAEPSGYQLRQRSEPYPVGRLVSYPPGVPT